MSPKSIVVYKELGETPLEALERTRKEHQIEVDIPMTYAGRLDPMAEGVMIVLLGEECKKKDEYLGLDKTYQFEVLVGFSTDTYDLLGLVAPSVDKISGPRGKSPDERIFVGDSALILKSFVGTFIQKYPRFSSKTVEGKQLFQLSKDDELPSELPEHEVTISKLEYISKKTITKEELQKEIIRHIRLVNGDFRQEEIIERWNKVFEDIKQREYAIFSCIAECSSGTYIRQLVADISEKIGVPLVTYSIKRTRVGEYK